MYRALDVDTSGLYVEGINFKELYFNPQNYRSQRSQTFNIPNNTHNRHIFRLFGGDGFWEVARDYQESPFIRGRIPAVLTVDSFPIAGQLAVLGVDKKSYKCSFVYDLLMNSVLEEENEKSNVQRIMNRKILDDGEFFLDAPFGDSIDLFFFESEAAARARRFFPDYEMLFYQDFENPNEGQVFPSVGCATPTFSLYYLLSKFNAHYGDYTSAHLNLYPLFYEPGGGGVIRQKSILRAIGINTSAAAVSGNSDVRSRYPQDWLPVDLRWGDLFDILRALTGIVCGFDVRTKSFQLLNVAVPDPPGGFEVWQIDPGDIIEVSRTKKFIDWGKRRNFELLEDDRKNVEKWKKGNNAGALVFANIQPCNTGNELFEETNEKINVCGGGEMTMSPPHILTEPVLCTGHWKRATTGGVRETKWENKHSTVCCLTGKYFTDPHQPTLGRYYPQLSSIGDFPWLLGDITNTSTQGEKVYVEPLRANVFNSEVWSVNLNFDPFNIKDYFSEELVLKVRMSFVDFATLGWGVRLLNVSLRGDNKNWTHILTAAERWERGVATLRVQAYVRPLEAMISKP